MGGLGTALGDIARLDDFASGDTMLHRLDPRTKLATTLVFVVCVVSFGKYDVSALLPYALYPVALSALGRVPLRYVARRLVVVSPLVLFLGLSNLILDRATVAHVGPLEVSGGLVSLSSVLIRFALTVGTAVLLTAITSFEELCLGLRRLGVPEALTVQLLMMFRYLFVLAGEAARLERARTLRSFGRRGLGMKAYAGMVGHLLLRSVARARRIHLAMVSRGFTGEIHVMRRLKLEAADVVFAAAWCMLFVALRLWNIPRLMGELLVRTVG